ncbi:MAG: YdeI/OmpD-associated family protein [Acidimicrobiales bacterium]
MTSGSQKTKTATVRFSATVDTIDATTLVRLPAPASRQLPSRGQVAVRGSINGHEFRTVLEPDGDKGHWMKIDPALRQSAHIDLDDHVTITLERTPHWPEPDVPEDLRAALASAPPKISEIWNDITPMARWEWVRWVDATASPVTRQRRVEVTISKMSSGKRRPCCFDLSACTDPALAKNGKLRQAT